MLKIRKTVSFQESSGVKYPWYWGLSYVDYFSATLILYIIPINYVVWAVREVMWKVRATPKSYSDKIYQKGFLDGSKHE